MTLTELIALVRALTGILLENIITNALITRFLNEALAEVLGSEDYSFNEVTDNFTLPSGSLYVNLSAYASRISRITVAAGGFTVTAGPSRKVLREIPAPVALSRWSRLTYRLEGDTVAIMPPVSTATDVRVTYQAQPDTLAGPGDVPSLPPTYHPMLAYRAAMKVLAVQADDTNRGDLFSQEVASYYTRLEDEYLLSHERDIFQNGEGDTWLLRGL